MHKRILISLLTLLFAAACTPDNGQSVSSAPEPETTVADALPATVDAQPDATISELAGTSWRLVKIMSMDDSLDEPEESAAYTLEFGADGLVGMQADCNRGSGSWTSESPGQLLFGPIAATMAVCPPRSLSGKYLAQFEWVRSYVLREGHLFLATMADGAIIEFAPAVAAPPAATVLGEAIRTADAAQMQDAVLRRLFDWYAAQQGIVVTESELDGYLAALKAGEEAEGLTAWDDLTPEEAAEADAMRRQFGSSLIRQWKLNKALYKQYGGRIIYQQLGPEPLDAYRAFLEERERAGDLRIENPQMADAFWRYFTDESIHDFMEPGSDDEARAFAVPPWQ